MFKRIDHVEIVPADFEGTIAFYTEVLGFTERRRNKVDRHPLQGTAYLTLGNTMLEVMDVVSPPPVSKEPWQVGFKTMALEVEDMEGAIEYLKTKGVEISREPVNLGTSIRAEFKDPNGLSIELRQWLT